MTRRIRSLFVSAATLCALAAPAWAQQFTIFSDDFEQATNPSNWTLVGNTPGGAVAGHYGTGDPSAAAHFQFAGAPANNHTLHFSQTGARSGTTRVLIFPSDTISATITFDMRYEVVANVGGAGNPAGDDAFPFEDVDGPEDIFLEYSTDGSTWINLASFLDTDPTYQFWANFSAALPGAALTPTTQLRWTQAGNSGQAFDHWAIDNLSIVVTNPEPSTFALFGMAALGLVGVVRRRRASKSSRVS